jgi:ATP-dependent DNA helicase RecG
LRYRHTETFVLLYDQYVHTIKLAVFDSSKKTVFRDRKELSGSLLAQMEDAYAYIDQFNRTRAEFEGLDRIDKRDYPTEALREALLNAITHRDYSFSGSTLISIFDDRIEFVTIGGLVCGLTYKDIMLGISALRNQKLANVFYRQKLIEAYGTRILKINESYSDCVVKPRFEVSDNAFKITLPNTNYAGKPKLLPTAPVKVKDRADRKEIVLRLAKNRSYITRKDVESELNVSQATSILLLQDMLDSGLLIKVKDGKQMKYHIAE